MEFTSRLSRLSHPGRGAILALLVGISLCFLASTSDLSARAKKRSTSSGVRSARSAVASSSKKKGKKTSARSRAARRREIARARAEARVPKALSSITIVRDSIVTEGVIYRQIRATHADGAVSVVHALTCVLRNPEYSVMTIKAENQASALERLRDFRSRLDTVENKTLYAAVNAHFWRAVTTTPIGPTVCNGEVCELLPYKDWVTCLFDARNRPVIDSITLLATLRFGNGQRLPVRSVNRRVAPDSVVVFNSFAGQTVPVVPEKFIEQLVAEQTSDSTAMVRDSSDIELSRDSVRALLVKERQEASAEYSTVKIRTRYLRSPAVNQDIPLLVLDVADSGSVSMPLRGCVISMGQGLARECNVRAGDTLVLRYKTSRRDSIVFTNSVCGTPILVSNGAISKDLRPLNSGRDRFFLQRLARTAIGTDITRNTFYMATVENNSRSVGFTLAELGEFMKRFGAYTAMNLDGGGSAQMLVGDALVTHAPNQGSRRISVALGIGKRRLQPRIRKTDAMPDEKPAR